jgi:hypothetical protein
MGKKVCNPLPRRPNGSLSGLIQKPPLQKQRDSSSAARIRDNQRRSRARHREYVEELKARLDEYDRRGVQATLEMRRAARAVALENSRLRSLLASHGITNQLVEEYLASFNHDPMSGGPAMMSLTTSQTNKSPPASHSGSSNSPGLHRDVIGAGEASSCDLLQTSNLMSAVPQETDTGARGPTLGKLPSLAHTRAEQPCCGPLTQCAGADEGGTTESAQRAVSVAGHDPVSPPTPPPPAAPAAPAAPGPSPAAQHLETSCTTAAHIMADMHRNTSAELAREALGCAGTGECFVRNITLFQLLDTPEAV